MAVLSRDQLESFAERGYTYLRGAFSPELALRIQDEIWGELAAEHGIERDDRTTWSTPTCSPRKTKLSATAHEAANETFQEAASELIGDDDWKRPATWGGFLVTFPNAPAGTAWDVPKEIWHWDGPPGGRGLLIFSFVSSVPPAGGGTLVVEGSHRLVDDYYRSLSTAERAEPHKKHRKRFSAWHPWLAALTGRGDPVDDRVAEFCDRTTSVHDVDVRVVELTDEPGDVVFCNLGLVHASNPNHADEPRMMRVKFLLLDESARV